VSSVILVAKILYLHVAKPMARGTQHTRLFKMGPRTHAPLAHDHAHYIVGSQCITQCTYNTLVGLGESVVKFAILPISCQADCNIMKAPAMFGPFKCL